MIMGNSTRTWIRNYDRNYHAREAQAGVDAMGQWRTAMLNRTTVAQPARRAHPRPSQVSRHESDSEDLDVICTDDELSSCLESSIVSGTDGSGVSEVSSSDDGSEVDE